MRIAISKINISHHLISDTWQNLSQFSEAPVLLSCVYLQIPNAVSLRPLKYYFCKTNQWCIYVYADTFLSLKMCTCYLFSQVKVYELRLH